LGLEVIGRDGDCNCRRWVDMKVDLRWWFGIDGLNGIADWKAHGFG
jgi:hypothetical protein